MITRQTIAIIGASGNMGSALARKLSAGNYRLLLKGRQPEPVQALAREIRAANPQSDIEASACTLDASWEADIIILALPYRAEQAVAEAIREVANQKVVISISNPLNEKADRLLTLNDTSAAEALQRMLPHSKVVKAFNTITAAALEQPVRKGERPGCFIAGDDREAIQTVMEMVEAVGFTPLKAGGLSASRTLEQMQLMVGIGLRYRHDWPGGRERVPG